jgi:hypothetical protein
VRTGLRRGLGIVLVSALTLGVHGMCDATTAAAATVPAATSAVATTATVAGSNLVVDQNPDGQVAILRGAVLKTGVVHVQITSAYTAAPPDDEIYKLRNGATLGQMAVEIVLAVNSDPDVRAAAMRWFGGYGDEPEHVHFYSGDLFGPGADDYIPLPPGDYYVGQVNNPVATSVPFQVVSTVGNLDLPAVNQAVTMFAPDAVKAFPASGQLHTGPLLVSNVSDKIHFLLFVEVMPGTTDDDVAAWLAGQGHDPTKPGGRTFGVGTQSPARAVVTNVPASLAGGTFMGVDYLPSPVDGQSNLSHGFHVVVTFNR